VGIKHTSRSVPNSGPTKRFPIGICENVIATDPIPADINTAGRFRAFETGKKKLFVCVCAGCGVHGPRAGCRWCVGVRVGARDLGAWGRAGVVLFVLWPGRCTPALCLAVSFPCNPSKIIKGQRKRLPGSSTQRNTAARSGYWWQCRGQTAKSCCDIE
jgi:hypothetical protein